MDVIITETLRDSESEATRSPYWLILDPSQNMRCSIHEMAGGITGPFFSRKDAEDFLVATRYNFSSKAKVYCLSGCHSRKYDTYVREVVGKK